MGLGMSGEVKVLGRGRVEPPPGADQGTWPLRVKVAIPPGLLDLFFGANLPHQTVNGSPVSVRYGGAVLKTQMDVVDLDSRGKPRSAILTAEVPPGGGPEEFDIVDVAQETQPAPALTPLTEHGLRTDWMLLIEGLDGSWYGARLGSGAGVVRSGATTAYWRKQARVELLVPGADSKLSLPHMGDVTADLEAWSGVNGLSLRLLWETGATDEPLAWSLFRRVLLRTPAGADVRPLLATAGMGGQVAQTKAFGLFELVTAPADDEPAHGVLPGAFKVWNLSITPPGLAGELPKLIAQGVGWGWCDEGPLSLHETAGLASGEPLPHRFSEAPPEAASSLVAGFAEALASIRAAGGAVEAPPESGYGRPEGWRHPAGGGYGGGTGGEGIGAHWFADHAASSPAGTLLYLVGSTECWMDRTRASVGDWSPKPGEDPLWNFVLSPEPLYDRQAATNSWPSYSQDPFGFREAQPDYRQATEDGWRQQEALEGARRYGTVDGQHLVRGVRHLWAWAQLYGDPMAIHLVHRIAEAVRADFSEGVTGAEGDPNVSALLWAAQRVAQGCSLGRELAWSACHMAIAYSTGSTVQREAWHGWMSRWSDYFVAGAMPSGLHHHMESGKEVDAAREALKAAQAAALAQREGEEGGESDAEFAAAPIPKFGVAQTYQEAFLIEAAGWLANSWAPNEAERESLVVAREAAAMGLLKLAWGETAPQPAYRFAVSRDGEPLESPEEVAGLYRSDLHLSEVDPNVTQARHVPLVLAAAIEADEDVAGAALDRFLGLGGGTDSPWLDRLVAARNSAAGDAENWAGLLLRLEGLAAVEKVDGGLA